MNKTDGHIKNGRSTGLQKANSESRLGETEHAIPIRLIRQPPSSSVSFHSDRL